MTGSGVGATKSFAASSAVFGIPFMIQRMNTSTTLAKARLGGMTRSALHPVFRFMMVFLITCNK
jgi:hypothetical protein